MRTSHTPSEMPSEWLQSEFLKRSQSNPRYSLRAFSRQLGIHSATVSQILSGNRSLTPRTMNRICTRLGVHPIQKRNLISKLKYRKSLKESKEKFESILPDDFEAISNWQHFALLELGRVKKFNLTPANGARVLGLSVVEASLAIKRLVRLGLLKKNENDIWIKTKGDVTNRLPGQTNAAMMKLQRQILEKALDALDYTPLEERSHSSMTMVIDPDLLPQARELTKEFRRKLTKFLESGNRRRVYHLGVHLYPVSSELNHKEK